MIERKKKKKKKKQKNEQPSIVSLAQILRWKD